MILLKTEEPQVQDFESVEDFLDAHEKYRQQKLMAIRSLPEEERPEGVRISDAGGFRFQCKDTPDLYPLKAGIMKLSLRLRLSNEEHMYLGKTSTAKDDLLHRGFPEDEFHLLNRQDKEPGFPPGVDKEEWIEQIIDLYSNYKTISKDAFSAFLRSKDVISNWHQKERFEHFFRPFSPKAKRILVSYVREDIGRSENTSATMSLGEPNEKTDALLRNQFDILAAKMNEEVDQEMSRGGMVDAMDAHEVRRNLIREKILSPAGS